MKSIKEAKKSFFDFLKKKKKTTFGTVFIAISFFLQNVTAFIQQELDLIDKNEIAIESHEARIKELEKYRTSKDISNEDLVSRTSFNAYIARQDEEYHLQQQKNDDFTSKISNLAGRVGELETITYELNANAINGGKYEDGDPD